MSDDRNAFAVMVATIYAARMSSYWSTAGEKTKESWRAHRKAMIEVSITEAVMICEQIERDFPEPPSAA